MQKSVLLTIFFISGIAGLMYEVLAVRVLGLVFGVTVYATSIVLMAFMAGLALGSIFWGRFIDKRHGNSLRFYGFLEIAVGVSALLATVVFIHMSGVHGSPLSYGVLYPVVFVLLLVPTFFMGGTLPIMAKSLITKLDRSAPDAGAMYALNTFGGVIGCLGTGFIFIKAIGFHQSLYLAVALNGLVAAGAFLLSAQNTAPARNAPETDNSSPMKPMDAQGGSSVPAHATLLLYALSGFCALGYEILWTRALQFSIGNSTYSFSLMLAAFLLGTAVGSAVSSFLGLSKKNLVFVIGLVEIAIGISVYAGMSPLFGLDAIIDQLWSYFGKTWLSAIAARFVCTLCIMGIPTILLGSLFPLLVRLCSKEISRVGSSVGTVYFANTAGTIFGSGLVGFVLLPLLGFTASMGTLASINIALGGVFLWFCSSKSYRTLAALVPLALIAALFLNTHSRPLTLHSAVAGRDTTSLSILYYKEGAAATVSVVRNDADPMLMLNVNGVYTAFTNVGDLQVHCLLGYLPYLFASSPHDALVVGLGMGVTSHALASAGINVDCVELAREETGASSYFSKYNGDILSQPNFHLIIDDGRHYLLRTRKKYGVITSNAVHVSASPYLYTKEFYELCKARLGQGGAMCQWLPTNYMPEKEFRQLIGAFRAVFPHTSVWYVNPGHYIMLGTAERLTIAYNRLKSQLAREPVHAEMKKVFLDDPALCASLLLMDEDKVTSYVNGVAPHSDNHPFAEFVHSIEVYPCREFVVVPPAFCADSIPCSALTSDADRRLLSQVLSATRHSILGETAWWHRDLTSTVAEYRKALSLYPSDARTAFLFGRARAFLLSAFFRQAGRIPAEKRIVQCSERIPQSA